MFMRYVPASRALILFMDGHSSHYCADTLALARENGIIILTLPLNSTHLLQPLDKEVFGPFKQHWKRVCQDFKTSHPGQVVNDYNFCRLFSNAWLESMTTSIIAGGFRTTGIYPLNRDAIQLPGDCNFANKLITPNVGFTPFKSHPQDGLYTSSNIKSAELPLVKPRPNCLRDITQVKTPRVQSKRIKAPEDKVVAGFTFTDPLANVFGIKGGHDKAIKCKYVYIQCIFSTINV